MMNEHTHSRIILDEQWLLMRGQENAGKDMEITHEGNHLHVKVSGLDYKKKLPFGIEVELFKLVGNTLEGDLYLSVSGNHLKIKVEFHGMVTRIVQQAMSMLGVKSIFFLLLNEDDLEDAGFRLCNAYEIEYDLQRLPFLVADGKGGEMKITDLMKFHSISVGNKHTELLIIEFSIK